METDYTVECWTTYQEIVASNVVTIENTQAEVDEATEAITEAQADLIFAGQAVLEEVKVAEAALEADDYVDYGAVIMALELPETTNTEVVAKAMAINDAIAGLIKKTFKLSFVAAKGTENLEGATIKVYSDEEKERQIINYLTVEAGRYYYTVEKIGFVTQEGSIELVNTAKEVEITLVANKYTITFVDHNDNLLETQTIEYGVTPEYKEEIPTKEATAEFTYTFTGWTPKIVAATGDATYTATYSSITKKNTVTFKDYDGTELKTEEVEYGSSATAPTEPTRIGYVFAGWDVEYSDVTEALTVIATYRDNEAPVLNYDGEIEIIVGYGEEFIVPEITATDNVDETVSVTLIITDSDSNVLKTVNTTVAGSYNLTYSAVDTAGNKAEELEVNVLVAPVIKNIEKGKFYFDENNALATALSEGEVQKGNTVVLLTDHTLSGNITIPKGVTLLLPFQEDNYTTSIKETSPGANAVAINRDNPYVVLSIPGDIHLNVNGTLTVNAQRTAGTPRAGYVVGGNYSQINMDQNSKININTGATLNSIGFITGEGRVEAKLGSTINEPMFVKSFRGGATTTSLGMDGKVFPFTQYTMNNIEVNLTINGGASHIADALLNASSNYIKGDLNLIGQSENHLIQLNEDGKVIRTYNTRTGKVKFDLQEGIASINNVSVNAAGIKADSDGMDMPLDGTWSFNVGSGTKLSINSWVMLLPGAEMNVENGGVLTVNEEGKLTVFNPYEYLDDFSVYPAIVANNYRVKPTFDYSANKFTKLNIDGQLNVLDKASISGKVCVGDNGGFNLSEDAITEYDIHYVWDTKARKREVKLWYGEDSTIAVVSDKDNAQSGDKVTISASVRDPNGNPLEGIEVKFSGGNGTWNPAFQATGPNGKVTGTYILSDEDSDTFKLSANTNLDGKRITAGANIKVGSSGGCPLVYSCDIDGYHLEHEPVPYSISKTFETITHGTLRKLEEVDEKYNIRITEEMNTETFINGFNLYAIDYLKDSDTKEVFVDIFGTPHIIKDRVSPKSFVDSKGNSLLNDISIKGQIVSSDSNMIREGKYIEAYETIFERPEGSTDKAKFMISAKANPIVDGIGAWFYDTVDGQNNIWWLDDAVEKSSNYENLIEAMNVGNLEVDLWDGLKWINQGKIAVGSNLLEEFLLPLDLNEISGCTEDIKVRIRGGAGFFDIDQVSMDFSKDGKINVKKIKLDSALKNGVEEVGHIINNFNDEEYVNLKKEEYVDLYYNSEELKEGYKRGFVVDFKGYFHVVPNTKENQIINNWKDMSYEEMIEAVLLEQPESADVLPSLNLIYELAKSVNGKPLEYKIEKIMSENVIPWLDR